MYLAIRDFFCYDRPNEVNFMKRIVLFLCLLLLTGCSAQEVPETTLPEPPETTVPVTVPPETIPPDPIRLMLDERKNK